MDVTALLVELRAYQQEFEATCEAVVAGRPHVVVGDRLTRVYLGCIRLDPSRAPDVTRVAQAHAAALGLMFQIAAERAKGVATTDLNSTLISLREDHLAAVQCLEVRLVHS